MNKIVLLVLQIILLAFISFTQSCAQQQTNQNPIRLNQIGFFTHAPKLAVIENGDASGPFYLLATNEKDTVFSATLSEKLTHQYGPREIRLGEFSEFSQPGSYTLFIPGIGHSHPFTIGNNVHNEMADAAIKSYYFQRASTALPEEYAGRWHRQEGHPDDSVLVHPSAATPQRPEGTVISSPKGWYDAGDYNKYIVNSGITMGTMFSLIEDYPDYANQIKLNIPEGDNTFPDLLDELLRNLRWFT